MKTIFSYILIFALLTLFALYLDAPGGLFVLIIFIAAITLSTALHIYAVKVFDYKISVNAELIEKGEKVKLTAVTSKAVFFLPTVFQIKFDISYHFDCNKDNWSVTLGRREKEQVFILESRFFGLASIGISSVNAVDILGIFKGATALSVLNKVLNRSRSAAEPPLLPVKIFPSVPDLSGRSEFVRTLEDASAYDDNEQNREIPYAMVGFPGYEHRDYIPGDPLKSINWKLSARRDRLLVRKPEAYAGGDQIFILDSRCSNHHDGFSARTREQIAIESMLALARVLTKQEILCRVYVRFGSEWRLFQIEGEDEIEKLRYAFTDYRYTESGERIPVIPEKSNGVIVFTASPDKSLYSAAETLRQKGIVPEIASPDDGFSNNWVIQETEGEIIFRRK